VEPALPTEQVEEREGNASLFSFAQKEKGAHEGAERGARRKKCHGREKKKLFPQEEEEKKRRGSRPIVIRGGSSGPMA